MQNLYARCVVRIRVCVYVRAYVCVEGSEGMSLSNDGSHCTLFGVKDIIICFTDLASCPILKVRVGKWTGHYEKKGNI